MRTLLTTGRPALLAIIIPGLSGLYSCSSTNDSRSVVVESLNECVIHSNNNLKSQIAWQYFEFDNKKTKPELLEKTKKWQPALLFIKSLSQEVKEYIDNMERDFLNIAGSSDTKTRNFFIRKGKALYLYKCLKSYKQNILDTDSNLKRDLTSIIDNITISLDKPEKKKSTFDQFYFENTDPSAALAILNRFRNVTLLMENTTITYVNEQCIVNFCGFTVERSPIVGQSSTIISPGEEIEIAAGVGSFVTGTKNQVLISGQKIAPTWTGLYIRKVKAPSKPGRYNIPIQIDYINDWGERQTWNTKVTYKVVTNIQGN